MLRVLWREPLVHFLVAGALLFAYFQCIDPAPSSTNQLIELSADDINVLRAQWLNQWRRLPTQIELQGLIDKAIREEVLYREGLRLGLDQDDPVVRNRMIQKMRFLTSETVTEPTERDLTDWLTQNRARYSLPAQLSFHQIYLGRDIESSDAQALAEQANRQSFDQALTLVSAAAQKISVPAALEQQSTQQIEKQFGRQFTNYLLTAEPQVWHAPVVSGFGVHLVFISAKTPEQAASLANPSVRQRVTNDWKVAQLAQVEARALESMFDRYSISIAAPE